MCGKDAEEPGQGGGTRAVGEEPVQWGGARAVEGELWQ